MAFVIVATQQECAGWAFRVTRQSQDILNAHADVGVSQGAVSLGLPVTVALERINKHFGATTALRDVSLSVGRGETLALLGENGAGKSTLIKILSGVYQPDSGSIRISGQEQKFPAPPSAISAGVVLIPQELQVALQRSIAENICLGHIPMSWWGGVLPCLNKTKMRAEATAALQKLGSSLNPDTRMGSLSFAERQLVVIARALTSQAKVLILDEPTAALGDRDAEQLFSVLDGLKRVGVSIIYITHRLPEIRRIADRCVVLRDGQVTGEFNRKEFDEGSITYAMTGRRSEIAEQRRSSIRPATNVESKIGGRDVKLASGEVVGVAGLIGSGAASAVRSLFGLGSSAMNMAINARNVMVGEPRRAIDNGIGFVAGERSLGAFPSLTVRENIVLPYLDKYSSPLRIKRKEVSGLIDRLLHVLDVRPADPNAKMSSLSGGNQQKVLFARCLIGEMKLMLLDEPTAGIDVGAKARIHELIDQFSRDGGSVVISSTDMPELLSLCDRILAIRSGAIVSDVLRNGGFNEAGIRSAIGSV